VVAIAWIARAAGMPEVATYLAIGAAMIRIWSGAIATGGWAMSNEMGAGTLDFVLISGAPLPIILFSKILATILYEILPALVSMVAVLVVSGTIPHVENVPMLVVSFVFAVLGVAAIGFFFCVLIVLVGGRAGFFMGLIPFGAVLGGFVLPLEQMPNVIRGLSMLVPSSWAMNSIWQCVARDSDLGGIVFNLLVSILLSIIWLYISWQLCKRGERRIIINGDLSRQW